MSLTRRATLAGFGGLAAAAASRSALAQDSGPIKVGMLQMLTGDLAQFGLPLEKLQTYSADINAVTAEQAGAAAKAYYDPASASLIVVGDAAQFWDQIKDKRAGMERLPVSKLNLDSATLK